MQQKPERGVGIVAGVGWGVLVLFGAVSCVGGGRTHDGGVPVNPVAEFKAPACSIHTQASVTAADARFFMIHGRKAYSLLILDQQGHGVELENYWKDDEGHHFAGNTQTMFAWHYAIPDKRGADGKLSGYATFTLRSMGDHQVIEGEAKETCELKFVAAQQYKPKPVSEPAPSKPELACALGETRECVGAGACRGGQACVPDRSGFSACDCGSATAPPASEGTTPAAAGEGKTEGGPAR